MPTLKPSLKRMLKANYDSACNAYLNALLTMWELDAHYGYWNSDAPGTIYHYGESHNLSMEDIIFCVENDIPENEVLQWEDYLLDAHEFGFTLPSLPAWHRGCPRTPQETFDRLRALKADLAAAIEEEKARCQQAPVPAASPAGSSVHSPAVFDGAAVPAASPAG